MQCIKSNIKSATALHEAATVPCLRRSSQDAPLLPDFDASLLPGIAAKQRVEELLQVVMRSNAARDEQAAANRGTWPAATIPGQQHCSSHGCLSQDMVAGMSNGTPSTSRRQLLLKACLVLLPCAAQPKATADAQCRGAGGGCTCAWMVGCRGEAWIALLSRAA